MTGRQKVRAEFLKLFDSIDFSTGGTIYKITLSVIRYVHRFEVEYFAFKIGFFQEIKSL